MTSPAALSADLNQPMRTTRIRTTPPQPVPDALAFLRSTMPGAADAVVVVEQSDQVLVTTLDRCAITERTIHLHAFSESARSQARVARSGSAWIGDSVIECESEAAGAREVVAQLRRLMCLGERVGDTDSFAEARITPYRLPLAPKAKQVDVLCLCYHEETPSGRLSCTAHRVINFVPREET